MRLRANKLPDPAELIPRMCCVPPLAFQCTGFSASVPAARSCRPLAKMKRSGFGCAPDFFWDGGESEIKIRFAISTGWTLMVQASASAIEPVAGQRGAAFRRAAQGVPVAVVAHDLDFASCNGAVAQDADPRIIERIPFPPRIGLLQDREFFFGQEMAIHHGETQVDANQTCFAISSVDGRAIG